MFEVKDFALIFWKYVEGKAKTKDLQMQNSIVSMVIGAY